MSVTPTGAPALPVLRGFGLRSSDFELDREGDTIYPLLNRNTVTTSVNTGDCACSNRYNEPLRKAWNRYKTGQLNRRGRPVTGKIPREKAKTGTLDFHSDGSFAGRSAGRFSGRRRPSG